MRENSSSVTLDASSGRPRAGHDPDVSTPGQLRRILVLTGLALAVVAVGVLVLLGSGVTDSLGGPALLVLAGAAVVSLAILVTAAFRVNQLVQQRIVALRSVASRRQQELQQFAESLRHGELRPPRAPTAPRSVGDDWQLLAHDIDQLRYAAARVLAEAPAATSTGIDQRVGVFVNLARRLQSLIHREIQLLDELENQVEDPELLKGLFSVDHLATRIRRHAENLAVLGGEVSRRQWSRPVSLYEVLRSAVAEVERYARVKLVRPIDGSVQGHAVADVVHLVAELVENATNFSNPQTQVFLRAERVTAGLAIEVEDRGLGLPREEQQRINAMLADPDQVDLDELLRDGRIGLYVVASLAGRHGIVVELRTSIYGGVQAVVVLPTALMGPDEPQPDERRPAAAAAGAPSPRAAGQLSAADGAGQTPGPASHVPPATSGVPRTPSQPEQPGSAPVHPPAVAPGAVPGRADQPTPTPRGPAPVDAAGIESTTQTMQTIPRQPAEPPLPTRVPGASGSSGGRGSDAHGRPEQPTGVEWFGDPRTAEPRTPEPYTAEPRVPGPHTPGAHASTPRSDDRRGDDWRGDDRGAAGRYAGSVPPPGDGHDDGARPTAGRHSGERHDGQQHSGQPDGQRHGGARTDDPRPELPKRRRQAHLAPELRDGVSQSRDAAQEPDPGLMSTFQRGFRHGAEDGDPGQPPATQGSSTDRAHS